MPVAPVYDLAVKASDLVAATHGRSFWVLDDLTPLRELTVDATGGVAHLFPPRPTVRPWQNWSVDLFRGPGKTYKNYMMALGTGLTFYEDRTPEGERLRTFLDAGENPPTGAIIYYALGEGVPGPVSLTFLDAAGAVIRTFTTKPETAPPPAGPPPTPESIRKSIAENKTTFHKENYGDDYIRAEMEVAGNPAIREGNPGPPFFPADHHRAQEAARPSGDRQDQLRGVPQGGDRGVPRLLARREGRSEEVIGSEVDLACRAGPTCRGRPSANRLARPPSRVSVF